MIESVIAHVSMPLAAVQDLEHQVSQMEKQWRDAFDEYSQRLHAAYGDEWKVGQEARRIDLFVRYL